MHALLDALRRDHGVECRALGTLPADAELPAGERSALRVRSLRREEGRLRYDVGYPAEAVPEPGFFRRLEGVIREFRPTVLVSQLTGSTAVLETGRRLGVCGVLFFRDALGSWHSAREVRAAARRGAVFVANSPFVRRRVRPLCKTAPRLVYPLDDWRRFRVRRGRGGRVAMVNAVPAKGLGTFLRIAHRLPHRRFLLVKGWPVDSPLLDGLLEAALGKLPNVELLPRTPDIRAVWRRTSLLLVPSVWEEPFPRVVLEAQASGIPVLASRRGGLPACVGEGGIVLRDYLDPDAWCEAIEDLLAHPARMASLSRKALRNVTRRELSRDVNVREFLKAAQAAHRRTLLLAARS